MIKYLKTIIGKEVKLELTPHAISGMKTENKIIRTNNLKVISADRDNKKVLERLIEASEYYPPNLSFLI